MDDLRAAKYVDVLPNYEGVSYIEGQARFASDGSLEVGDRTIRAPKVIIATGSSPLVPDIPGVEDVDWLDSTSALEQSELPKSLMVMGGGYIGVEIAQIFARAGVEVTIVTRRGLLPEAEPEVSEALTKAFVDEGIKVLDGLSYDRFEKSGEVVTLHATHNGVAVRIEARSSCWRRVASRTRVLWGLMSLGSTSTRVAELSSTRRCAVPETEFMPQAM